MKKNLPLISVTIPAYNRSHCLGRSVQSVLDHSYANLEIIIVDDGSTDETEQLVASWTDSRICYIKQANQCSKINLKPVLRCIQSGIPLRALDVMAAGVVI